MLKDLALAQQAASSCDLSLPLGTSAEQVLSHSHSLSLCRNLRTHFKVTLVCFPLPSSPFSLSLSLSLSLYEELRKRVFEDF